MPTPVQMPKQGNSVEECLIVEWHADVGAAVESGQPLCTIETDKASFEVEAPTSGTLLAQFVPAGELAPVLTNIAVLGNPGEDPAPFAPDGASGNTPTATPEPAAASAPAATPASAPVSAPAASSPATPTRVPDADGTRPVSPRARKAAQAHGMDPLTLTGSGAKGRVISRDVEAAAAARGPMTPLAKDVAASTGHVPGIPSGMGGRIRARDLTASNAGASSPAPVAASAPGMDAAAPEIVPYRGIRKLIGERMRASLQQQAQLTLNASANASALLAYRTAIKTHGEAMGLPSITLGDLVAFAVSRTLPRFPELNALFEIAAERVLQYRAVHLGIAVDTPRGLMVPVIPDADVLSLAQLSEAIRDAAGACRDGAIDPDRLTGGTFTITNLGTFGVESFTPVLNSPQVAILGVCGIRQEAVPAPDGGCAFEPRMGLSLTIDHQVVDGAPAARFLQALAKALENPALALAR